MYLSLSLYLSSPLSFCWSGHVFSSLWSNVSKVKSLKNCTLKVLSKCNCHCHCLCLCLCICLCSCVFVGQVMFLHDFHQFCKISVWSGRLEGFESNTMTKQWVSEWVSDQGRPRAARAAKNSYTLYIITTGSLIKRESFLSQLLKSVNVGKERKVRLSILIFLSRLIFLSTMIFLSKFLQLIFL